ncbi:MAG: hypothetical protein R3257_04200, partial [bacterium]|nr:hypothetical protein [bacterium]
LAFILRRARRRLRQSEEQNELWIHAERSGESVQFSIMEGTPAEGTPRNTAFKVDAHGRIGALENLTDTILREALESYRILANQPPALGEGNVVYNPTPQQIAREIRRNPDDPFHRSLREALEEAREDVHMQLEDGSDHVEAFLIFRERSTPLTQGNGESAEPGQILLNQFRGIEIIPSSQARRASGELAPRVLRITQEGFSEEAVQHAAGENQVLVHLLRHFQDNAQPGTGPRPDTRRAGPEETTGVHDMASLTPPEGSQFEPFSLGEDTAVTAPGRPSPRDLELSRGSQEPPARGLEPEPTQVIPTQQQAPLVRRSAERSERPPARSQNEEMELDPADPDLSFEEILPPETAGETPAAPRSDAPTFKPPSGPHQRPSTPPPPPPVEPGSLFQGTESSGSVPPLPTSSHPPASPPPLPGQGGRPRSPLPPAPGRIPSPPPVPGQRRVTPPPPPPPRTAGRPSSPPPPPPPGRGGRRSPVPPPTQGARSIYDTIRTRLGPNNPLLMLVRVLENHNARSMTRQQGVQLQEDFVVRYDRENSTTPFRVVNSQELQRAMSQGDEGAAFFFFRRNSVWNEGQSAYEVRELSLQRVLGTTTQGMESFLHQVFGPRD